MKSWYEKLSKQDNFQYIGVDRRILESIIGGHGTVWLRMETSSML